MILITSHQAHLCLLTYNTQKNTQEYANKIFDVVDAVLLEMIHCCMLMQAASKVKPTEPRRTSPACTALHCTTLKFPMAM